MVREPGEIGRADRRRLQRHQRPPVQHHAAERRQRFLDRESRQLVPEAGAQWFEPEHAGAGALLEATDILPGKCLEEP